MKIEQVAVQLYTLRSFLKDSKSIAESLRKVKAIGYKAVQISGMGPIAEVELNAILDGEGLICCATHENGDTILNNPQEVVDRLGKLKCKYTAYPYPGGIKMDTRQDIESFAQRLEKSGKALFAAGQVLTYHNHAMEFRHYDGKTMLDILYENTDPRYLQGEIDTYWVQAGGGNPEDWCRRLKDRLPLLHMKDFVINAENKAAFAEIGFGNLNFKSIVKAAEESGCKWFIVEQDTCPGDPFESLEMSFDYIRGNLCN